MLLSFSAINKIAPILVKIFEKGKQLLFVAKLSKYFFYLPVNGHVIANQPSIVMKKLSM